MHEEVAPEPDKERRFAIGRRQWHTIERDL